MRILQVTPTYFADRSVIGGGERYVTNVCRAVAAAAEGSDVVCDVMSFGPERAVVPLGPRSDLHILAGTLDHPAYVSVPAFHRLLASYDVIHVHQCLLPFGLYVAGRARLARKLVIGTDHGGGESQLLEPYPILGELFDAFHAQSAYAAYAFTFANRPVAIIRGPVDDAAFSLGELARDRSLIVAIGRFLSHKGFETIIDNLPDGCTLVIAGRPYDGAYLEFLRGRARNRRVSFETGLDDAGLLRLVQSAGLHVHASTHVDFRGTFAFKPELLGLAPLECMATGLRAIVSRAGALAELDALDGCTSFETGAELRRLLREYAEERPPTLAGAISSPTISLAGSRTAPRASGPVAHLGNSPAAIRNGVVAAYGLAQFGQRYLDLLRGL